MKKLTDDIIKAALEDVSNYLDKSGSKSIFIFEEHPSAWRELSRLIVEEHYTAEKAYEIINAGVPDLAPWNYVSFEMPEEDYRLFLITKNSYRVFVDSLNKSVKEEN